MAKTEDPKIVRVSLPESSRSYDIVIGDGIIGDAGELTRQRLGQRRCVIVSDGVVAKLYLNRLEAVMAAAGHVLQPSITVKEGEGSKDFSTLQTVLEAMLRGGLDRKTLVVALGGGMVGDLAGLAASLAMRGVDVAQIPTTLLSQVDSSVGGKTAINSRHGKNVIGSFHQPRLVLADVSALDSLPRREMSSGYAEIVKYGLICDPDFFRWCAANGNKLLRGDRAAQIHAIGKSCEHKARIVAADERETGDRALLNLGHTFGHALETATGYGDALLHGEAVAIGMAMAFSLSEKLGLCPSSDAEAVARHLEDVGLPARPPALDCGADRLVELMEHDKKSVGGKITLVLARGIGQAFISRDVSVKDIKPLWEEFLAKKI